MTTTKPLSNPTRLSAHNPRRFLKASDLIRWQKAKITAKIHSYTEELTHPKPGLECWVPCLWLVGKDGEKAPLGYLLKNAADFDSIINALGENTELHIGKEITICLSSWRNEATLRIEIP